jgi:hypothetical protein
MAFNRRLTAAGLLVAAALASLAPAVSTARAADDAPPAGTPDSAPPAPAPTPTPTPANDTPVPATPPSPEPAAPPPADQPAAPDQAAPATPEPAPAPASAPEQKPSPAKESPEPPKNLEPIPKAAAISILGKKVKGPAGEDMGRVVDLLLDRDARPEAVVIDFGGFLGVGSRKIAIDWRLVRFIPDEPDAPVALGLGKSDVQAAPEYKDSAAPPVMVGPPPAGSDAAR